MRIAHSYIYFPGAGYIGSNQGGLLHELNQDSYQGQGMPSGKHEKKYKNQMDKLNYINAWNQVDCLYP